MSELKTLKPIHWILLAVILLRIPSLFEPYWYGDEAIYLTLGEGIRQGLTLYKDIFDHKPPLIYILSALAGSIFWFKFLLLVSHIVTVFLFSKLVSVFLEKSTMPEKRQKKAVLLAVSLFALFTTLPLLEGNIANAELFLALPIIAGLLMVFSSKLTPKRLILTGGVFSLAILYKVPAVFEIAALIVFWWLVSLGSFTKTLQAFGKTLFLGIGITLPILATILYYTLQGALHDYLAAGLLINIGYTASWSAPVTQNIDFLSGNLVTRTIVLFVLLAAIAVFKKRLDQTTFFVSLWFVFSLFAALLSGRPYPHYLLQAIAPLALLVTILVNGAQKQRFWTTPLILVFLASLVFYKFSAYPVLPYYQNFLAFTFGQKGHQQYLTSFDVRTPRTYRLAQFIASTTKPKDKIFIWGTEPELYALSRRLPPGRYVTSFHISDFGGAQETIQALSKNLPKYILIDTNEKRDLPGLANLLQKRYTYLHSDSNMEVWKEFDPSLINFVR